MTNHFNNAQIRCLDAYFSHVFTSIKTQPSVFTLIILCETSGFSKCIKENKFVLACADLPANLSFTKCRHYKTSASLLNLVLINAEQHFSCFILRTRLIHLFTKLYNRLARANQHLNLMGLLHSSVCVVQT